jgi:Ca2+-binding RTX toxin-like protein
LIETLEGRRLFAAGYGMWVGPNDTIVDFNGGAVRFTPSGFNTMIVAGTNGDDTIKVSKATDTPGGMLVEINGQSQVFTAPGGGAIMVVELWGYGGNDHLQVDLTDADNSTLLWADLHGGDGNDTLVGADRAGFFTRDNLYGDAGNDTLVGNAGDDHLYGGFGDDTLLGGAGSDELWGNDEYQAPPQPGDSLDGGADGDRLEGAVEQAADFWQASLGGGTVEYKETTWWWGKSAHLYVYGTAGNDVIRVTMDAADNVIFDINGQRLRVANAAMLPGMEFALYGKAGNDRIEVNLSFSQADALMGGSGSIGLRGGEGDDVLIGSGWRDDLEGRDGWESSIWPSNDHDELYGRGGDDTLHVHGPSAVAYGEGGNDKLMRDEDYLYVDGVGWTNTYGTSAGLDGGTGVDQINGVTETFNATRDTEPDPLPDPEPEPGPDPEPSPNPPDDDDAMSLDDIIGLAHFVGPLDADQYSAWTAAVADLVGTATPSAPPPPAMLVPARSIDWLGLSGDGEDELISVVA